MVKSARWVFFYSWFFQSGKYYFHSSQSSPPRQGLVGNLLRAEGWNYGLTIFSRTHLEFIPHCHQGAVLACRKLWESIHKVDHTTTRKGPRRARVYQYFPYTSHRVGYQAFEAPFGTQILRMPTQVHPGRGGVLEHLLTRHSIPIWCQNRVKVQI